MLCLCFEEGWLLYEQSMLLMRSVANTKWLLNKNLKISSKQVLAENENTDRLLLSERLVSVPNNVSTVGVGSAEVQEFWNSYTE